MARKVFSLVFFCLVIFFTASSQTYAAVYVANYWNNNVTVYPLGASTSTPAYTISGLNDPIGVAVDSNYIYVANWGNNTVTGYAIGASTSTPAFTISTGVSGPVGVAVDANYIYVANYTAATVTEYAKNNTSAVAYTISGLGQPAGVAVDANYVYVADISRWDAYEYPKATTTAAPTYTISATLTDPSGIAVDTNYVYVANPGTNTVTEYALGTTTTTVQHTISGLNLWNAVPSIGGMAGVALDANYAYVSNTQGNTVTEYAKGATTSTVVYTISGLNKPAGVAVDGLNPSSAPVPTMTEWGMIIFAAAAGLMSVYYLRRQRRLAAR